MNDLTIGSLCSGYGGLEMGVGLWLGALRPLWHAEVDPAASRVLKTHWPEVPNLGDLTDSDFWDRAAPVHIEMGGIPCQPFSAAGRKLGEADARYLWPFWRDGIARRRPPTVIFENVANLTQGKMRATFDGIVTDLVQLGYDVRWCVLGACAVGACHHRHRVFLLAVRTRTVAHARKVDVKTCGGRDPGYLPTPVSRDGRPQGGGEGSAEYWEARAIRRGRSESPPLGAVVAALLPTPQHRDTANGRGVPSPGIAAQRMADGRRNLDDALALLPTPRAVDGNGDGRLDLRDRPNGTTLPTAVRSVLLPSPRATDASNGGPNRGIASGDIALPSAVQPERWGKYADAVARHESVVGRPAPEPTEEGPRGGRRLAAAFAEWMMMLPEGHLVDHLNRNEALQRAGNGVLPLQAATALALLWADLAGTVDTRAAGV